jgi:hypothetical protein
MDIANKLEGRSALEDAADLTVATGAAILDFIAPSTGAGVLAPIAELLLKGNLREDVAKLGRLIAQLEPDLAAIPRLEDRLDRIEATILANQSLVRAVDKIVEAVASEPKRFRVETVDALQRFRNVTIRDMAARFAAHNGGVNSLEGVQTYGHDVEFVATSGSVNDVKDGAFNGASGSVLMSQALTSGQVVAGVSGEQPFIGLGPNGMIGFGPGQNGRIGFRAPPGEE